MTRNRRVFLVASILLVWLLVVASAQAAEEGGSGAVERATGIFKWINFAFVAGALVWLCLKKGPAFFGGRAEAVSSAIRKATEAKATADAQLREAETKLANLQKEIAELRATSQREAAAEGERIRAFTQIDLQKIVAAAKAEIEAAERAARLELKALAAKLAVEGAELLLAKQLTPRGQDLLFSNFVESLEGRPN